MSKNIVNYTPAGEAISYTGHPAPTFLTNAWFQERDARREHTDIEVRTNLGLIRSNADALLERVNNANQIANQTAGAEALLRAGANIACTALQATADVQNTAAQIAEGSSELAIPALARMSAAMETDMTGLARDQMHGLRQAYRSS